MKILAIKSMNTFLCCLFALASFGQSEERTNGTEDKMEPIFRNGVMYVSDKAGEFTLTLEIVKLESNDGKVMIGLITADKEPIAQAALSIQDKTCSIVMDSLPPGKYVVRYYHDENENGEMDTALFGIPTEGYGFSNDARGFMGPPDFEDMIFELKEDMTMKMKTVN